MLSCMPAPMRFLSLLAGFLLLAFESAAAQVELGDHSASRLAIGTPVRVQTWTESVYFGTLQESAPDHLLITRGQGAILLPTPLISRVAVERTPAERRRGRWSGIFKGAAVGSGIGFVVGLLLPVKSEPCPLRECPFGDFSGLAAFDNAAIGMAIGGVAGAGIGAAIGGARWKDVPLPMTVQ
jgi:hypothetical protein